VTESLGPGCEVPARPYGPLDERLHALLRAVAEYSDGLVAIAQDVAGRTVSSHASQQRKD
jgi:hypothetical protein